MENEKLSLFEAASVVAGLGIGGGIMAVPYLASLNGLLPIIAVLLLAFAFSILLHLMITEMIMRNDQEHQLVETFGKFLFKNQKAWAFTWLFFVLIVLNFYALLAAFIVGSGDIIVNLTGIPLWAGKLIAYICAATPIFFGLKALGISEKFGIIGIIILVAILILGSFQAPFNTIPVFAYSLKGAMALYGMTMFAFSCFFSIPQAVKGLNHNKKMIPKAVILGISINFLLVLSITIMALLVSKQVTQMAIIGWGNAIGPWAIVIGSAFVFLAVMTSYWSTSYALAIVIKERLSWPYPICWLAATLPTLVLALSGLSGFMGFMRLAGGLLAIMIAILVIPAFRRSRNTRTTPEFKLGVLAHPFFQWLLIIAYGLVVAGSLMPVQ